jgi:glycosyltransferase involved in cell wall biosynthesis
MKILQLCLKPPLPAKDGGCIAMHNITQGLLEAGHKVKILTIFTFKHDLEVDAMPSDYVEQTGIEGVFIDTRLNAVDAFSSILTSDSYNISRFFSTDFDIRLSKLLRKESFDVVHLESLFMTPYLATIRRLSMAPVVLRAHNVEHIIWQQTASGTGSFFKRIYLNYLHRKLKEYELSMLNEVSAIAAISDDDRNRMKALNIKKPIQTIPFGVDIRKYPEQPIESAEIALFHLGAMDWGPNTEGVKWFLQSIWPEITLRFPGLKLYLAGRNMPDHFMNMKLANVEVVGEVESAVEFMQSKAVMIVPLLSASGVRVKIIEGLALGRSVVATSIAAEGLGCTHGQQLLIADDLQQWIEALTSVIQSESLRKSLSASGREHIRLNFDLRALTAKLVSFYKEIKRS